MLKIIFKNLIFLSILVFLSGCTSVKKIPILEIENYTENKIIDVEVHTIIKGITLNNDEHIKFINKSGRYFIDKNKIEGISDSDTLVSVNLDNIKFVTIEKDNIFIVNPSIPDTSIFKGGNILEAKLFKERFFTKHLSDTSSYLVTSIDFDKKGAVFDNKEKTILGKNKNKEYLIIPLSSIESITINKLPIGFSKNEISIRGGLNFSKTNDKNKIFSGIDSEVGNDFSIALSSKFSKNLSAQLEFSYSKKNFTYNKLYTIDNVKTEVKTDVNLTYADISFLSKYRVKNWSKNSLSVFIGPQLGYNISSNGTYDSTNYNSGFITGLRKQGNITNINNFDTRIVIGGEFDVFIKSYNFLVDLRYSIGTSNIYTNSENENLLNDIWITNLDGTGESIRKSSFSFSLGFKVPI